MRLPRVVPEALHQQHQRLAGVAVVVDDEDAPRQARLRRGRRRKRAGRMSDRLLGRIRWKWVHQGRPSSWAQRSVQLTRRRDVGRALCMSGPSAEGLPPLGQPSITVRGSAAESGAGAAA